MTTYILNKATDNYIIGVVHTLKHLNQCNIETIWEFIKNYKFDDNDSKALFIRAVEELNNLKIIDTYYKFVDNKYVELSKEQEDEADVVEIIDY